MMQKPCELPDRHAFRPSVCQNAVADESEGGYFDRITLIPPEKRYAVVVVSKPQSHVIPAGRPCCSVVTILVAMDDTDAAGDRGCELLPPREQRSSRCAVSTLHPRLLHAPVDEGATPWDFVLQGMKYCRCMVFENARVLSTLYLALSYFPACYLKPFRFHTHPRQTLTLFYPAVNICVLVFLWEYHPPKVVRFSAGPGISRTMCPYESCDGCILDIFYQP